MYTTEKEVTMKNKINIDDFLILIYWTKNFSMLEKRHFEHEDLLQQAESYHTLGTPLDTKIHPIDELLIESYQLYNKLLRTEKQVKDVLNKINIPFFNSDNMVNEMGKYIQIFEDLMENYTYTDPEIIGIQRGILNEKLKYCIEVEDYEKAAKLRDIINS